GQELASAIEQDDVAGPDGSADAHAWRIEPPAHVQLGLDATLHAASERQIRLGLRNVDVPRADVDAHDALVQLARARDAQRAATRQRRVQGDLRGPVCGPTGVLHREADGAYDEARGRRHGRVDERELPLVDTQLADGDVHRRG